MPLFGAHRSRIFIEEQPANLARRDSEMWRYLFDGRHRLETNAAMVVHTEVNRLTSNFSILERFATGQFHLIAPPYRMERVRPACNRETDREFRGRKQRVEDPFHARDAMRSVAVSMSDEKVSSMSRLEAVLWRYVVELVGEVYGSAPKIRDLGSHIWELPIADGSEARN